MGSFPQTALLERIKDASDHTRCRRSGIVGGSLRAERPCLRGHSGETPGEPEGGPQAHLDQPRESSLNCTNAKAPVPRSAGDRALFSLVLRERIARGNGYQQGFLALTVATLLLRAACRRSTWAYRDLSRSILFHPFSGWPFTHTQHKRLLLEPSRIPHHEYALSAPRLPESNDPSGPMLAQLVQQACSTRRVGFARPSPGSGWPARGCTRPPGGCHAPARNAELAGSVSTRPTTARPRSSK